MKPLYTLLTLILLCACTYEEKHNDTATVERTFGVAVTPMKQADGSGITRSDKTTAETAIHTLRFVQFDGTSDDNTVCQQGTATLKEGKVTFPLLPLNSVNRVYLLANAPLPAVTNSTTTLAEFEKLGEAAAPIATVDENTGLPMCAFADFNPMSASPAPVFHLQTMVAKVTVTFNIAPEAASLFKDKTIVTLRQAASATAFATVSASDAAQRPVGVTYQDVTVGTQDITYTCYVAENLAGRNPAIKKITERSVAKAQPDATYIEFSGETAKGSTFAFSLFVGDPTDVTDFNVLRNHAYTLVANIRGLNTQDERLEDVVTTSLNQTLNGSASPPLPTTTDLRTLMQKYKKTNSPL